MRSGTLGSQSVRFGRARTARGVRATIEPRDEPPPELTLRQYLGLNTKPNKRQKARNIAAETISDVRSPCVSSRRYDVNSEYRNAGGKDGNGGGVDGGGGGNVG